MTLETARRVQKMLEAHRLIKRLLQACNFAEATKLMYSTELYPCNMYGQHCGVPEHSCPFYSKPTVDNHCRCRLVPLEVEHTQLQAIKTNITIFEEILHGTEGC